MSLVLCERHRWCNLRAANYVNRVARLSGRCGSSRHPECFPCYGSTATAEYRSGGFLCVAEGELSSLE